MMHRPAGMGGGHVLRVVGRAVGAGVGGAKAGKGGRPARTVSVESPPHSSSFSATPPRGVYTGLSDEWVNVDDWAAASSVMSAAAEEEEEEERYVFGPAPTREEAEEVVASLQQIFVPLSYSQVREDEAPLDDEMMKNMQTSTSSFTAQELDWVEPSGHLLSSRKCYSPEHEKVLDAFHLLQINPSIQRMVVSLSSDKDVWNAVMNNEVVQEIKKSFEEAGSSKSESSDENKDTATGVLRWVLKNTTAKIVEFMEKINKIVNALFHAQEEDKDSNTFDTALRSSFMLSVLVFIIVVVTRVWKA